jgi:hypothetical protein
VDIDADVFVLNRPAEHSLDASDLAIDRCTNTTGINHHLTNALQLSWREVPGATVGEQPDYRTQGDANVIHFAGGLAVLDVVAFGVLHEAQRQMRHGHRVPAHVAVLGKPFGDEIVVAVTALWRAVGAEIMVLPVDPDPSLSGRFVNPV